MTKQEALSSVDVLTAFAAFTETSSGQTCRPTVLPAASRTGQRALLDLRGLWHPSAVPGGGAGSCIVANDLVLGGYVVHPFTPDYLLSDAEGCLTFLRGPSAAGSRTLPALCCSPDQTWEVCEFKFLHAMNDVNYYGMLPDDRS